MFINSGQKGAVEGWPCLRAAAGGCRRWAAGSPCPVAGHRPCSEHVDPLGQRSYVEMERVMWVRRGLESAEGLDWK